MMRAMPARQPRRRAPSSHRIHSLWLTTLIVVSFVLVVVGFATSARRTSDSDVSRGLLLAHPASGPWLSARRVGLLPAAVQDAAAAPVAGHGALLLGGLDQNSSSTARIQLVGAGPHRSLGTLGTSLHDAAAATIGSYVYLFGGGQTGSYTSITRVDPHSGHTQSAGRLPEPRSDLAAATVGRTAYLVGGFTGINALRTILAFTPSNSAKAATAPRVAGRLPQPLRYAAAAGAGGRVVIAGGIGPHGPSAKVLAFDPRTGKVTRLGSLPSPVSHAPAVTLGNYVYVLGGRAGSGAPTREVFAIDPRNGAVWLAGHLPSPLSDAAAGVFEGGIIMAGGRGDSGTVGDILYLKPAPRPQAMVTSSLLRAGSDPSVLPADVLIADKANNRLVKVSPQGQIVWTFPHPGELPRGQTFLVPDDAFFTPDGRRIVATEEDDFVISVVDMASGRLAYRYGHPGQPGSGANHLWNPDDAIMFPNGRIVSADIKNCRLIELKPPLHHTVAQMGTTQACGHNPPSGFGSPNGAFPTSGGGMVVTEITGDWIDVFNHKGRLLSATNPPGFTYPSDTNEVRKGVYLTVDYTQPGATEMLTGQGKLLWHYAPTGPDALNHPSLALPLPNGDVLANDDYNDRVIVVDPHTSRIVWQYGHTGHAGRRPGYLRIPDGVDLAPPYSLADRFPDARGLPGH